MATYADYTTVDALRANYLSATETTQDTLLLSLIRQAARDIDAAGSRSFYPRIETRYYDTPTGASLRFDDDLLAVTAITNGDGVALATADYKLYPLNEDAKHEVRLLPSSGEAWETDSSGNSEGAISVTGTWGYHVRYSSAWADVGAVLTSAVTTTTGTTALVTAGALKAGDLVKADAEYIYTSAITTAGTATVIRAVNGSTATTHTTSAAVLRWTFDEVERLCCESAAAYYRLRSNPVGDSVSVGDQTFVTPRDVRQHIAKQVSALEMAKVSFG